MSSKLSDLYLDDGAPHHTAVQVMFAFELALARL